MTIKKLIMYKNIVKKIICQQQVQAYMQGEIYKIQIFQLYSFGQLLMFSLFFNNTSFIITITQYIPSNDDLEKFVTLPNYLSKSNLPLKNKKKLRNITAMCDNILSLI